MSDRTYGVDVASTRADDLDRQLLSVIMAGEIASVLDLGCGSGGLVARAATAGACVTGIDIATEASAWAATLATLPPTVPTPQFIAGDMRAITTLLPTDAVFDAVVLQRVLHYIPQPDARALLKQLTSYTTHSLYVAVTGLDSAIGAQYPHAHVDLEARFGPVLPEAVSTFNLGAPLCLYTQAELVDTVTASGWQVERVWTSAFGNHKLIARL